MCQQALPAIRIGRQAAQIRRRLEEGKPMDYEPMLPKDLLKVASKLSKEEAVKVIDQELAKPKQTGAVWTNGGSQSGTWTTSSIQPGAIVSSNNILGNPWEFRPLGQ